MNCHLYEITENICSSVCDPRFKVIVFSPSGHKVIQLREISVYFPDEIKNTSSSIYLGINILYIWLLKIVWCLNEAIFC